MIHKVFISGSFILISFCFTASAQEWIAKGKERSGILFMFDTVEIGTDEFHYVYRKNSLNNQDAFSKEDITEYLQLYIDFKMKVNEARLLGLDTLTSYTNELQMYLAQLAEPYLSEKEVTQALLREAYDRLMFEIDVSHILVRIDADASPLDTLNAFKRISQIRQEALADPDFTKLAIKYSEEPAIELTKGHLGYFTVFQMVYPFESAAYATSVGSISEIIRTRFGYHIIKVHDRRPTNGKVKVNHIMIRFRPDMTRQDSVDLRARMADIHLAATEGEDWPLLVRENSEDQNTRLKGGELPVFAVGEMIPELAEVAFSLRDSGEISQPFTTPYGWHLLQFRERTPYPDFNTFRSVLERKVENDSRSALGRQALISRLKAENDFKAFPFDIESATVERQDGDDSHNQILFTIDKDSTLMGEFAEHILNTKKKVSTQVKLGDLNRLYEEFVAEKLIDYEKMHLAEKYPDYKHLSREYREGILLFEIMNKKIWEHAGDDSVGLTQFYMRNFTSYKSEDSLSLAIFALPNDKRRAIELKSQANALLSETTDLTDFAAHLTDVLPETRALQIGWYSKGEIRDLINGPVPTATGVSNVEGWQGEKLLLAVKDFRPGVVQDLDAVKGSVISDYQEFLENQWVLDLRQKYRPKVNKSELKSVFKALERK